MDVALALDVADLLLGLARHTIGRRWTDLDEAWHVRLRLLGGHGSWRGVDPLKQLEKQLKRKDDYERHLVEQAPSVLTQKQVGLMFDQFEYRSEQRADAIKIQEQSRAEHPEEKDPIWSPAI